jgi:ppGpp synthetase/RelA/SpoT-type nucleotidyltranferase
MNDMANLEEVTEYCLQAFEEVEHDLSIFNDQVRGWFATHPRLSRGKPQVIHSVKHRLKDKSHLAEKIRRKLTPDLASGQLEFNEDWVPEEVFKGLADLAGVRVLLLHQKQFAPVHAEFMRKVENGDWILYEEPKAYTWDPDSAAYFEALGIGTKVKDSHYTSLHYVIRPRPDSMMACEIQVRTLFEEIWGEVDHALNYPRPIENIACREQLRVLAKVVGAGSRLVDSIFNTAEVQAAVLPPDPIIVRPIGISPPPVGVLTAVIPPTEKPAIEPMVEGEPEAPELGGSSS